MGGPRTDCGLLAEQFRDINFDIAHWINHLVVWILQRAHHPSRLPVSGVRPEESHKSHHRYNSASQANQCIAI